MYDVTIIGAGVVGAMLARRLSAFRLRVCLLEKENDVAMGASKANSAIVHAGFDALPGTLKARLNVAGAAMMEQTARELGVPYQNNGSLVAGFDEADRRHLEQLLERGRANGVPGLFIVEQAALRELEPNISPEAACALVAPTAGIVCPYALTVAAVGHAMDHDAVLKRNFCVTAIEKGSDGFYIHSEGETVKSRAVINAAGLFADEIAAMTGDNSFTIHPRSGEYILLDKSCGSFVRHTIFRTPTKAGKGVLVTPTVDGNLLLGPTATDMEDKADTATTAAGLAQVKAGAEESVKGIPFTKAITSFCGLRAVGSTGDFIINMPFPGFVNVAGIESPGLTASPAIAVYVTELMVAQGMRLEPKPAYSPVRRPMYAFREASLEEKNRMIRQNPAYGRVACRCEGVTEGEITEAIRRNPKPVDLDGVKRRTRAQMGRCQGGFCSPHIIEMLAKELGISCEAVTKSGGGSYVITGKTKEVAK